MFSKHFVTYGDRSFNIQKKRIRYQANQLNFFDEIHVFSQKDISKEFKLRFKNVFNDELGGGYCHQSGSDPISFVLKAGALGNDNFFFDAMDRMRQAENII